MSPSSRNNNCSVPMLPNDEQDLSMTFSSKVCMQHNNNINVNEDLYMPQHLMTPRERTLSCDSLELPLLMMPSFDSVSYSSSHVTRSSCSSRYLEIPALTATTTTTTTSSPASSTGPFFPNFESDDSHSVPALAVRLTPRIEGMQYGF